MRNLLQYPLTAREASDELRSRANDEYLDNFMSAAVVDVLMEGPRLQGWNRSQLDRAWKAGRRREETVGDIAPLIYEKAAMFIEMHAKEFNEFARIFPGHGIKEIKE